MGSEIDVVVIGAGQAGLAVSRQLLGAGVEHVVLEREDVGGSWSRRWDSFCLVTPNHTIRLPDGAYTGEDPHGFLSGPAVSAHLQDYATVFGAPVRTGVDVRSLRTLPDGRLELDTAEERATARVVVVATGAYQRPLMPASVAALPAWLPVLDSERYRNPRSLPDGAVLVVGSGQSGCQIAEELALAGRDVVLACGRAPWIPRRIESRDTIDWLLDTPFFELSAAGLPHPTARLWANPQATGVGGGHDLTLRTLDALGVRLAGRLAGADDTTAHFAGDLAESVEFGDARYADIRALIERTCTARGAPVPEMPVPPRFTAVGEDSVPLRELGAVVVAAGYRPGYRSWIHHPAAFDDQGFPLHRDGASTAVPGLFFVGVHFLRTRKSSLLVGVAEDAAVVAHQVAEAAAGRARDGPTFIADRSRKIIMDGSRSQD
ncbi:MAG TPA: NAD(P)/FAD-dependent oxidoreductase [Jiangellales bacterium]|nr:NAD(P)/FAD-dependent oxidoreductase [Jiangellales bacterium]